MQDVEQHDLYLAAHRKMSILCLAFCVWRGYAYCRRTYPWRRHMYYLPSFASGAER
jgi:hypothetical protein